MTATQSLQAAFYQADLPPLEKQAMPMVARSVLAPMAKNLLAKPGGGVFGSGLGRIARSGWGAAKGLFSRGAAGVASEAAPASSVLNRTIAPGNWAQNAARAGSKAVAPISSTRKWLNRGAKTFLRYPLYAAGMSAIPQGMMLPGQLEAAGNLGAAQTIHGLREGSTWERAKRMAGMTFGGDQFIADYLRRSGRPEIAQNLQAMGGKEPNRWSQIYNTVLARPLPLG